MWTSVGDNDSAWLKAQFEKIAAGYSIVEANRNHSPVPYYCMLR